MRMDFQRFTRVSSRSFLWVANVTVGLMLIFSAYGGIIDPRTWVGGALVAMTFPLWLAITPALAVVNLMIYRRALIVNAVSLLLCAGPLFTYCPINISSAPDAGSSGTDSVFTLLTYNVFDFMYHDRAYHGDVPNVTISYIIKADADIVCLQEAAHMNPLEQWHFDRSQVDSVKRLYPYTLINDKIGLAVLSKVPVDSVSLPKGCFDFNRTSDFQAYTLNMKGRQLTIFNVHFQSIGLTPEDRDLYRRITGASLHRRELDNVGSIFISKLARAYCLRADQAEYLSQMLRATSGNVIVAGDFNDIPDCHAMRAIEDEGFTDVYSEVGFGPGVTYHANRFYFRIDNILYRGDMRAVGVERATLKSSDHYPLLATFKWK